MTRAVPRVLIPASRTLLLLVLAPVCGLAQESRCADCHFANVTSNRSHLLDWQMSTHSRSIGCEACHGGDPTTFERWQAHSGILSSVNPSSPTHYTNLPQTCGRCHTAVFESFEQSRHFQLLQEDNESVPSCSTCHSDAGGFLLSSRGLERTCKRCHGEDRRAPRQEYPALAASSHDQVDEVRDLLETSEKLIERMEDSEVQRRFRVRLRDAEVPLESAIDSAHRFTFETFDEQIARARSLADALFEDVANAGQ